MLTMTASLLVDTWSSRGPPLSLGCHSAEICSGYVDLMATSARCQGVGNRKRIKTLAFEVLTYAELVQSYERDNQQYVEDIRSG